MKSLLDVASILRLHIIAIAVFACLVFSDILVGVRPVEIALLGGLDWLLINLLNRVTDVKEDIANGIRGTERLVGRHRLVLGLWIGLLVTSMGVGHALAPELTPWRALVQVIGVAYSYRVIPTPSGWKRLKDLYFFKNFMSAMLFVLTVLVYPLVTFDFAFTLGASSTTVAVLVAFFVPFELTYEILYDMRDLEGDRLARVPTYPVVHGLETAARIVDGLLGLAALALVVGLVSGAIGLREGLMVLALPLQFAFYRPRFRRGLTSAECIGLTWLGAVLLGFWLFGTDLWASAGLPVNVRLF
jgi:4-hydroxybenzoate polyprenyltransferase